MVISNILCLDIFSLLPQLQNILIYNENHRHWDNRHSFSFKEMLNYQKNNYRMYVFYFWSVQQKWRTLLCKSRVLDVDTQNPFGTPQLYTCMTTFRSPASFELFSTDAVPDKFLSNVQNLKHCPLITICGSKKHGFNW